MGEHGEQMENCCLSGSDKVVYIMEAKHNRKFYTTKQLCSLPPKDFALLLTTGKIPNHRNYKPIKSSLSFSLMINSVTSKV